MTTLNLTQHRGISTSRYSERRYFNQSVNQGTFFVYNDRKQSTISKKQQKELLNQSINQSKHIYMRHASRANQKWSGHQLLIVAVFFYDEVIAWPGQRRLVSDCRNNEAQISLGRLTCIRVA